MRLFNIDMNDIGFIDLEEIGEQSKKLDKFLKAIKNGGWSILNIGKETIIEATELKIEKNNEEVILRYYAAFDSFKSKVYII